MRRLTLLFGIMLASCGVIPLLADTTSLQSILTNVNGTTQTDFTGYNVGAFNQTTGLGTLTFTYNPGPGTYFFDVFFDHSLNAPFFNEFGTVNGTAAADQRWEIGDSYISSIYTDAGGDLAPGGPPSGLHILDNTNSLQGTADDYSGACVGANCNGDFAAAMQFDFTLVAGQQEVITLSVSHTDPGGFNLEDTHPIDPGNPSTSGAPLHLFISGSAGSVAINPTGGSVPEPFSVLLLGTVIAFLMVAFRRRFALGGR